MTSDWTSLPLDAFVERQTARNTPGDPNVLTISARHGLVSQREFFNKQVASKDLGHYFLLERGDFAYNKSYSDGYPVGAIKRLDKYATGVVSPLYICFRLKRDARVCSDFLVQYFEAGLLEPGLRSVAKEGARNHGLLNVKPSEFFCLAVRVPPLPEQRKIAAILSSVDDAIESTQAVIDQLGVVKKAMMAELLTRGLPGRHTRFKQTEIGEVPEEWELQPLGDLVDVLDRLRRPLNSDERRLMPGPFPYYGANGEVDRIDRWIFDEPLLLVAEDGGYFDEFATRPIAYTVEGKCWINNHAHVLRARGLVSLKWLHFALVHKDIRPFINSGTRAKLNQADLRRILVPVPRPDEQERVTLVYGALLEGLRCNELKLEALAALKSALMSVLLTGEVRVKPDEDAA